MRNRQLSERVSLERLAFQSGRVTANGLSFPFVMFEIFLERYSNIPSAVLAIVSMDITSPNDFPFSLAVLVPLS